ITRQPLDAFPSPRVNQFPISHPVMTSRSTCVLTCHSSTNKATDFPHSRSHQLRVDLFDGASNFRISVDRFLYFSAGVKHRAVIPPAEVGADLLKGKPGELPGKIHSYLSRQDHTVVTSSRF